MTETTRRWNGGACSSTPEEGVPQWIDADTTAAKYASGCTSPFAWPWSSSASSSHDRQCSTHEMNLKPQHKRTLSTSARATRKSQLRSSRRAMAGSGKLGQARISPPSGASTAAGNTASTAADCSSGKPRDVAYKIHTQAAYSCTLFATYLLNLEIVRKQFPGRLVGQDIILGYRDDPDPRARANHADTCAAAPEQHQAW